MKRISVEHLSKEYQLGSLAQKDISFRELLFSQLHGLFKQAVPKKTFHALHDVSFDVQEGEVLGVIGKNGSGKSTLLKIVSRITSPTSGKVTLKGRVASLLEVGTGFHGELSGRENIYLSGVILGMKRWEVQKYFDEIVSFASVEQFLDIPVKKYSSGMRLRLAFSVAAHLRPEILLIDEVLAVGDYEFEKKCIQSMSELGKAGRTILFVSHNLVAIKRLCSRVLLLAQGEKQFLGNPVQAIALHLGGTKISQSAVCWKKQPLVLLGGFFLHGVRVINENKETQELFFLHEAVILEVTYVCENKVDQFMVLFSFYDESETLLFSSSYIVRKGEQGDRVVAIECVIPKNIFAQGAVIVGLNVYNVGSGKLVDVEETALFSENHLLTFFMKEEECLVLARSEGLWQGVQGKMKPLLQWKSY